MYARQAEVFAAYTAYTDYEIGRVIDEVQKHGQARQHADHLHRRRQRHQCGRQLCMARSTSTRLTTASSMMPEVKPVLALNALHYNDWGSDKTYPHMSVAWAWAFDTPFKWTKQVASHFGGTRQGLAISWPGHIKDVGGIRTQFHHVIDIVPTILEAAGIQAPDEVNGIKQKPIEGVSMLYTFDSANANAPSKRDTQYFEMVGNRAIYHDGWVACHHAAFPVLGDGNGQAAGPRRLPLGALPHRRRLFGVQRPGHENARQAEGNAGAVPERSREIPGLSAG